MKKLQKYACIILLACNLMSTSQIHSSDPSAQAGNFLVRLSRATGLSDATNASILWTLCLTGSFFVYRWYKNREINSLKQQVQDLTSTHAVKKNQLIPMLLKPYINAELTRQHSSFDPHKTGEHVNALYNDIIAQFLSSEATQSGPTASDFVRAIVPTVVRPEIASTVTHAATQAIDVATGGRAQHDHNFEDINSIDDLKKRIKQIIVHPEMRRKIEDVYPYRYKDSNRAVRGIMYCWYTLKDCTVGR